MLRDAWEYINEFASDLVTLIGGIASVVLAFATALKNKPLPNYAFWVSSIACFLFSSFRVWRNKHRAFLVERQKNSADERQLHELKSLASQQELVRLQRENQQATEARRLERLDEGVLKLVRELYAELEAMGSRPGAMFFPPEWIEKAVKELKVSAPDVHESLGRLKQAGKLNAVRW